MSRTALPKLSLIFLGTNPKKSILRSVLLITLIPTMCYWFMQPTQVVGNSMQPNYKTGQIGVVNRTAYKTGLPKRGDIVVVASPVDGVKMVKRIVGLPGDTIRMVWGRVYINERLIEEPYAKAEGGHCTLTFHLRPDHFWVIGDNRQITVDALVTIQDIVGKAYFVSNKKNRNSKSIT